MSVIINRPDLSDVYTPLWRPSGILPIATSIGQEVVYTFPYLHPSALLFRPLPGQVSPIDSITSAAGVNIVDDALATQDDSGNPIVHQIFGISAFHNDATARNLLISLVDSVTGEQVELAFGQAVAANIIVVANRVVWVNRRRTLLRAATTAIAAGATVTLRLAHLAVQPGQQGLEL